MHLSDYLNLANLDDAVFASMVGGVSKHAVKKWRYRERVPEADRIIRIEEITGGKVTLRDWRSEPTPASVLARAGEGA